MVQTLLPRDAHNTSIQTMAPVTAQSKAYTGTSARVDNAFTSGVKVVELRPTTACHIAFGDNTVVATTGDPYLHQGERVTYHVGTNTHVAAIQSQTGGTLYVTELA